MKLVVLGASGACGQWAVRLAVERGHEVTAVARPQSPYSPPSRSRLEQGLVTEASFVRQLLEDHEAAISCVGIRRASLFPWSRLLSPGDLVQQLSRSVASAKPAGGLGRFLWISAGGVGSSIAQASFPIRRMIRAGGVGVAYRDLERAEKELELASFPTLAVRPVTLTHGPPGRGAAAVERYGLLSTVRRSDVARWMLDVADGTLVHDGQDVLLGAARRER